MNIKKPLQNWDKLRHINLKKIDNLGFPIPNNNLLRTKKKKKKKKSKIKKVD
jgi:hypothetical protein